MAEHAECEKCHFGVSEEGVPGGWLFHTPLVTAYTSLFLPKVPGWYVVQVNRHAETLADLTEDEARAMGKGALVIARAVSDVMGYPRIYSFSMCEASPHYHVAMGAAPNLPEGEERGPKLLCRMLMKDAALFDVAGVAEVDAQVRQKLQGVSF